ncbi:hypothetical protein KIN20_025303 [Parelaphostrongylus tenuis]|uniref:Uncharacterized protein n=1 Tax=Parelaphostrongylus tenuis TaxID=148309 RepID=A0AAD5QXR5_PARTN|nr:hypothetical protein KIN20_025303 [Parelaphostrongylus tenuis]
MERNFCTVQPHFSLQAPSASSPGRHRPSIKSLQLCSQQIGSIKRLMSLQGATIASAPSVEQENYRTPKPSFDKNGGKSFDCCGPVGSLASDSNGLVKNYFSPRASLENELPASATSNDNILFKDSIIIDACVNLFACVIPQNISVTFMWPKTCNHEPQAILLAFIK